MGTYIVVLDVCPGCRTDVSRRFGLITTPTIDCPRCGRTMNVTRSAIQNNWQFNFGWVAGLGTWIGLGAMLVLDPAPDLRVVTEEQFGPVLPILPFSDLEPLIDQVNEEASGLCSSVWTANMARAQALAARLRTGTTWINDANAVAQDDRAPFGGFRQSGMGRQLGVEGLLDFTEHHTVTYPAE